MQFSKVCLLSWDSFTWTEHDSGTEGYMLPLWTSTAFKLTFSESIKSHHSSGLQTWPNAPNKPSTSLQYRTSSDKRNFSKSCCPLLNEVTLTHFSSRFHPFSHEANNSVCERFKSLTRSWSSCVMRWGDADISGKKSGFLHTILVLVPCPLSQKLSPPSSSMVQSLWGFGMGKPS
jgi:hypothetical protein